MKTFIRLICVLVFASTFAYLLYYRLATPAPVVIVVEKPVPVIRHWSALQRALHTIAITNEPFAREFEAVNRFHSDVQNLLRNHGICRAIRPCSGCMTLGRGS